MHQNRKGFTLIELLIVVVIIGILAAIAIPKFAKTKDRAYVTAMKSDLKNLSLAEEGFFVDSSKYSSDTTALGFKFTSGVVLGTITPGAGYWSATVTHGSYPGHTCGISINTANPINTTAGEGVPECN